MSLLDQLWDDTVAGPRPDNGLGKLRKHKTNSNSFRLSSSSSPKEMPEEAPEEAVRVTRSIMIIKPPGYQYGSPPVSPAGSTPSPVSPFSGSRETFRFRRRSTSDAYEKANEAGPRSPSSPHNM